MPTLHRLRYCKIEMRFRDHQPPHVHVLMADGREVLVEIEGLRVVGNIPGRELVEALEWIVQNTTLLLEAWEKYHR